MAKKKIYAVKEGKTIGIFKSWEECRDSVDGYPGAEYKGFLTEEEANKYMDRFAQPENISKEEVESDMGFTLMMF